MQIIELNSLRENDELIYQGQDEQSISVRFDALVSDGDPFVRVVVKNIRSLKAHSKILPSKVYAKPCYILIPLAEINVLRYLITQSASIPGAFCSQSTPSLEIINSSAPNDQYSSSAA